MYKSLLVLLINLIASGLMAQLEYTDLEGIYSFWKHDIPGTETPSKCDCDYHKWTLKLQANKQFAYVEQRGRLSPKIKIEYGTWKLTADNIIILNTMQRTSTFTPTILSENQHRKTETYTNRHEFKATSRTKLCKRFQEFCLER